MRDDEKDRWEQETHNQVVIPEPRRIAFPLHVLPNGQVVPFHQGRETRTR